MADDSKGKVIALRPRLMDLHATIRRVALEDRRLYLSDHAIDRMDLRSITRIDVVRVLASGHIDGEIVVGNRAGEWKCKVVANIKGSREIGVVTIVINDETILVKTVEWEDL